MVNISKEDAESLAGFIDQWLPVCGEKTAERACVVKECLTTGAQNMGGNIIVTGMPEPLYDGKALIAAIEGAIANGARLSISEGYGYSGDCRDEVFDKMNFDANGDDNEEADDFICPCCIPDSEDEDQWARSL